MAGFVEGRDKAVLVDVRNDAIRGGFTRRIDNGKVLAKVTEDRAEEAECVSNDEVDALLVAVVADDKLQV